MLKVLDLFSGIGGFSLGLERTGGFETVAFCEIEEFPQKVLRKHWPDVPIFNDIRTIRDEFKGSVDVITGGYPCQPFSVAGKREGQDDDRHLWPEMFACIKEYRPSWVIGENVSGHINMGLDDVLSDLEGEGYTARAFVIPAVSVDARHRRDRVWIVANARHRTGRNVRFAEGGKDAQGERPADTNKAMRSGGKSKVVADTPELQRDGKQHNASAIEGQISQSGNGSCKNDVPNAERERGCGGNTERQDAENARQLRGSPWKNTRGVEPWLPEPNVGRVANGIPNRVDRLKGLGNAVVPQIPEIIGYAILEAIK